MKFDIKFKSMDYSQSLVDYAEEKFAKLEKYEIRPVVVHITFSQERHEQVAQVYIKGLHGEFRAKAYSDSLQSAIDLCLKKMKRQMEREKSKIKHHHHYEHSEEAMLNELARGEDRWRKAS